MPPVYDYACESCEKREEIAKRFADFDREELCKACRKPMKRQVTMPGFVLKDGKTGWAKTGYASIPSDRVEVKYKNGRKESFASPINSKKLVDG
jgi:putative FmdB family regulatory protein